MIQEYIKEWREIKGYNGIYQVSNTGDVRSVDRMVNNKIKVFKKGVVLSKYKNNGYFHVGLCRGSKTIAQKVHRLVATAFLDNSENKPQVNHKDCDKLNNNLDNLEWATQSENMIHAFKNGLYPSVKGESHRINKLSNGQVRLIRQLYKKGSVIYKELGKLFHVSETAIGLIVRGDRWNHLLLEEVN